MTRTRAAEKEEIGRKRPYEYQVSNRKRAAHKAARFFIGRGRSARRVPRSRHGPGTDT